MTQPIDIVAALDALLKTHRLSNTGPLMHDLIPAIRDLMDRAAADAVTTERRRVLQLVRIFEENAQTSADLHTRQAEEHMAKAAEYAGRAAGLRNLAAELSDTAEETR